MNSVMTRIRLALLALIAAALVAAPASVLASQWTQVKNGCQPGAIGLFATQGPLVGWHSHSYAQSPAGCHLYFEGKAFANPVNWANYYLPVDAAHDGWYAYVKEFVPCDLHSSATKFKWIIRPKGTGWPSIPLSLNAGATCNAWFNLGGWTFYERPDLSQGGYVSQVDNTSVSGSWISVDTLQYIP